jgi:hypothetical protein
VYPSWDRPFPFKGFRSLENTITLYLTSIALSPCPIVKLKLTSITAGSITRPRLDTACMAELHAACSAENETSCFPLLVGSLKFWLNLCFLSHGIACSGLMRVLPYLRHRLSGDLRIVVMPSEPCSFHPTIVVSSSIFLDI